jgi:hypothetical protein
MTINLTTLILSVLISIGFGIVPGVIAGNKGYSRAGFTVYGVLLFLPALIHSLLLPDIRKGQAAWYWGDALRYSVIGGISFAYAGVIGAVFYPGWLWRYLFSYGNVILVLLMPFLALAAILGKKYVYSIVVYSAVIVLQLYNLVRSAMRLLDGRVWLFAVRTLIPSAIVSGVSIGGIAVGLVLTVECGIHGKRGGKAKGLFLLPAMLQVIAFVLDNVISRNFLRGPELIVSVVTESLMVIGVYALGKFLDEQTAPVSEYRPLEA